MLHEGDTKASRSDVDILGPVRARSSILSIRSISPVRKIPLHALHKTSKNDKYPVTTCLEIPEPNALQCQQTHVTDVTLCDTIIKDQSVYALTNPAGYRKPKQPTRCSVNIICDRLSSAALAWTPMALLFCYYIGSVAIYTICDSKAFEILWYIYMVSNAYIAFSVVIETFLSYRPWKQSQKAKKMREDSGWKFPVPDDLLPRLDLVMVAYLPNEQDIIEHRARYLLERLELPTHKYHVNIVYNTPKPLQLLEDRLHGLNYEYSNVRVIKVPQSTSKADNINYFLSLGFQSDVVAIYDTDHFPHPYGPRFALENFVRDEKIDIVQGRCVVLNAKDCFVTSMVAAEFDRIYAISHPGRTALWGFGLFCGSNGFWKTDLLRSLKMDASMLTEDIDCALRALNENATAIHDVNVVSYELAPTRLKVLFKQRLRWAQGWAQASIRHVAMSWRNPSKANKSARVRFGILSLLLVREISYYLVTQYTCFVVALVITAFPKSLWELSRLVFFTFPLSEWLFLASLLCLITTMSFTFLVRSEFTSFWTVLGFSFLYPVYLLIVASLGLYSHARALTGYSSWNPTSRG